MDQFGTLELAWSQGYGGSEAHFIDHDVICFQCGKSIKFVSESGIETVFAFKGNGQGPFTAHKINKYFAVAEQCLNPKIYVFVFPTFKEFSVLEGGAQLEFQQLVFSASEFLLSLSGLPGYQMTLWKYETGIKLASVKIGATPPTSICFNPANWRQVCVTKDKEITVWQTEQADDKYILLPQHVKLPPEDPNMAEDEKERDVLTRASTRMTQYTVDVPKAAIAGLVGEMAERLSEIQDETVRVAPVSQTWTPTGDIYVGCKGGQLLKIDGELMKARVLYYPPPLAETPQSRATSAGHSKTSIGDSQPIADELSAMVLEGSLNCIALHRKGLYAVGTDGVLRRIETGGDEFKVAEQCNVGAPISSLAFSPNFSRMALCSPLGSIHLYDSGLPESLFLLRDFHHGQIIAVSAMATGSETFVSVREDGEVQVWKVDNGKLLSSVNLGAQATALACSPLAHIALVGTLTGHIFCVDLADIGKLRVVHRFRMYGGPVSHLQFDQNGRYILSAPEGDEVFVADGRPSQNFSVLGYAVVDGSINTITNYTSGQNVQVVVTTNDKHDKDQGANKLTVFSLTDKLINDLKISYNSLKCDFRDEAINKMQFHLTVPTEGAAFGENNTLYAINKHTKKIYSVAVPETKPRKMTSPEAYLSAETEFTGHQLAGAKIMLSPHNRWLASYGTDGCIMLRAKGSMDRHVSIMPHEYHLDGVHTATFSEDCHYLLSSGYDGVLICFAWNFTSIGISKAKSAIEIARSRMARLITLQQQEDDFVQSLTEWNVPVPVSRSASVLQQEERERTERKKQEAIDQDIIYKTPTPTPKADATWLEERELEALIDEDQHYAETKTGLRTQIRDIRRTIQDMMKDNEVLPDIEKLGRHEFDLDVDEQTKLQSLGNTEIARVREEIEFDNLAKMYLRDMIKKECWDEMKVKGRALQAFNSNLEVSNFPMKERSEPVVQALETVTKRRQIEIAELAVRKQEIEQGQKPSSHAKYRQSPYSGASEFDDDLGEGEEGEEDSKELPSTTGSLGAQFGGGSDLFYSQFELHTREQKTTQIILLEDAIHRIKNTFNKEFDEVFGKKEQEISKIKEKNKRIVKIMEDLDIKEEVMDYELSALEKPEMLLTVDDSEVKVEKFLTAAQRKKLEQEEKAEEARRLLEKGDNARDRALDMMMGGVLEIKKEDELKKDVPKPHFMISKAEEEWSEDEKKLVGDYEKKVKDLTEEREKYRKQLETELRKLQGIIQDGMAGFDETLNALFLKKIKVMMVIYQEELKIQRLRFVLLKEEELEVSERELVRLQQHKKILKQLSSEAASESSKNLARFKDEYDILLAEDKVMDRSFKREFADVSAIMQDQLYRLFRKRPRGQKFKGADTPVLDVNSSNPFAERPSTARQNSAAQASIDVAVEEMDREGNMPEGLELHVWKRMCTYRKDKMDSEQLVKVKSLVYAEMTDFEQRRKNEDVALEEEIRDIEKQIKSLKEDRQRFTLNLEVQLLLKQGQVEVDAGSFVHNYTNSVLTHRTVVEELNSTIKQLGESKITSMVESKDFRKGIIQLEWEHKRMLMQMTDLQNKMKDIQFIKVTREIQAFLNEADYDAKKQQEIAILEQTILLQKKHHDKNMREKKRTFNDLQNTIQSKDRENSGLDLDLNEINVCVNERNHIDQVNADRRMDTGAERRYQEIVQRRKLVDLAKAQAQEVAVLRAEVERLRMRTFPALVQVEH
ncbi:cilia- and flagella-associated protein 43-like isoform X1 [Haliotis cracherodii]|uniref:cilia- and flagella-associated protein 43-like isoform X1 n=1 Tax=Haliotis cracherodii TaxID=6455 RepID=UPI0039E8F440